MRIKRNTKPIYPLDSSEGLVLRTNFTLLRCTSQSICWQMPTEAWIILPDELRFAAFLALICNNFALGDRTWGGAIHRENYQTATVQADGTLIYYAENAFSNYKLELT
jgi:hypothetical protein